MSSTPPPHSKPPHFSRPSKAEMDAVFAAFQPWFLATHPLFLGLERIPTERPLLFVGNHTFLGIFDMPLFAFKLLRDHDIFLRALGDHSHFHVPIWGWFLQRFGVVDGNRDNCARLMQAGETLLVFPGGSREAVKRDGKKYRLDWNGRLGFVKMALQHGCTIVPFSCVGGDDTFDILVDTQTILKSPLGAALRLMKVREDLVPPLIRGIGPTLVPKPQRMYFRVADPVPTAHLAGQQDDPAACTEIFNQTFEAVDNGLRELLNYRRQDPEKHFANRLGKLVKKVVFPKS